MNHQTGGVIRLVKALRYSWQGLGAAWRYEAAFRQEAMLALCAIVLACWLDVGVVFRVLLIGAVLLVLIVELLNSAVEAVVDRIGEEWHALAKRAKDMGSAAVLLALLLALITWAGVLWQVYR